MKALILFLALIIDHDVELVEDHFEIIEINTIFQVSDGDRRLKQYIWWDDDCGERVAQGWLDYSRIGRHPVRVGNHYELVWFDGRYIRKVTCRAFIVTETWGRDPEVENRQLVPMTHRRGLSDPSLLADP